MNTTEIAGQIAGILRGKLSLEGDITGTTAFADLELDSLVLLELSVLLEKQFGVHIPEDELADAGTVEAVADLVSTRAPAATATA
ncbi:phosphopantetheine-binding protein [Streptomyces sp. NPDC048109]|uniref:phosphopantetheine-binding protein n=1 Tax=unclassified Streptomyces TaxID=2593676 RepID=UPI0033F0518A